MSKKSPSWKAKAACQAAIDRLFAICGLPQQDTPFWKMEREKLVCQIQSLTARQAVMKSLRLALQRHGGMFLQKPILTKNQVNFDGTSLAFILLYAILAESLGLILDEIEDLLEGKKPIASKPFLLALSKVVKRHLARRASGEKKWAQALDGILSVEEFERKRGRCLEKRMEQKKQQLFHLFEQIRSHKKISPKTALLAAEVEHAWRQTEQLGLEAKEAVWTHLIDPRIHMLKQRLS